MADLVKVVKKALDDDCDLCIDTDGVRGEDTRVLITRTGSNGEQEYRIQLDLEIEGEYEPQNEEGADLDSIERVLGWYFELGGSMASLKYL